MSTDDLTGYKWSALRAPERFARRLSNAHKVAIKGKIPAPHYVTTKDGAVEVLGLLAEAEVVAIDSEFTPEGDIVTWQVSNGEIRVVVDHKLATKYFKRWLADPEVKKVFHHINADIPVFRQAGLVLGGVYADTMVLDWLVNENRRRHALKICAADWLDIPMTAYVDAFGSIPEGKKQLVVPHILDSYADNLERFIEYASLDAYCTYWLFVFYRKVLRRLKAYRAGLKGSSGTLWDYYLKYEADFTNTIRAMMDRGMRVDKEVLHDIGDALDKELRRCRHVFTAYAPSISVERVKQGQPWVETIEPENINPNSPAQLSSLFYDVMGLTTIAKNKRTGKPDTTCRSTNAPHLEAWSNNGNILAEVILSYRKAHTQRSTFIGEEGGKGLLSHIVSQRVAMIGSTVDIHVARSDLKQIGTVTGRISSSQPNLQNIPARKDKDPYRMRRAFVARPGCKLIVADYSQIELRIMAHLSRDREMMKAFKQEIDLHSKTAKAIFDLRCDLKEVKYRYPDVRNHAKAINFGLQYGMRAGRLADAIGTTKQKAQAYLDAYFRLYSGVYLWMKRMVEVCRAQGYVTTLLGRRRRIPEINMPKTEANWGSIAHAENQAMNTPIQGGAGDIIKIAMNQIEADPWFRDHEAELLLQVHDELIVESPAIHAHVVCAKVKEVMEDAYKLRVPVVVEAHVGDNWEEAK